MPCSSTKGSTFSCMCIDSASQKNVSQNVGNPIEKAPIGLIVAEYDVPGIQWTY